MNLQQMESWKQIIAQLGPRYSEVILAMTELSGNATLYELSMKTGRPFHQLSGRITELRDRKLILESNFTRPNPATLRKQTVWILDHQRVNEYLQQGK